MIITITQDGQTESLVGATRIEDTTRPGSSTSKAKIFCGDSDEGEIDLHTARIQIFPNDPKAAH